MNVLSITAEGTHPLRLLVLRPGGRETDVHWPIDLVPEAFHLAVDDRDGRLCVASFQPAPHPTLPAGDPWQVRGMATHPANRGRGAGRLLVEHALLLLRERGADVIWCNARLVAVPFYERLGFAVQGPAFSIPGIGPHHVMGRLV